MVDLGMSSRVGELVKVPTGVLVQADGTVLLTLDARERRLDPCTPNPCNDRGYYTFTCEVVNYFTVKCSSKCLP